MKFKDYNLELIDDDYSENLAEKDKEENHLFVITSEDGNSYFHKSKTQKNIVYAFHCEPKNGWCVITEKYKIIQ